jgi:hypothetical protein
MSSASDPPVAKLTQVSSLVIEELEEFLKLTHRRETDELTEAEKARWQELRPKCEREPDHARLKKIEQKIEAGETLDREDVIARDTALRRTRPRNRAQYRHHWRGRSVADLLFGVRRTAPSASPGRRAPRSRRANAARSAHGPPGRLSADDDPPLP